MICLFGIKCMPSFHIFKQYLLTKLICDCRNKDCMSGQAIFTAVYELPMLRYEPSLLAVILLRVSATVFQC